MYHTGATMGEKTLNQQKALAQVMTTYQLKHTIQHPILLPIEKIRRSIPDSMIPVSYVFVVLMTWKINGTGRVLW
jgi:hypothetical protein